MSTAILEVLSEEQERHVPLKILKHERIGEEILPHLACQNQQKRLKGDGQAT
ncbi:hypothetical protein [Bartonella raoultii]|uniref:hypothetical protein n=1 Tax=Bartonella raoultii TaxID=1457020 RepID=UPI001ABBBC9D|nr:hypothetical protein [Bartonella raoultii]